MRPVNSLRCPSCGNGLFWLSPGLDLTCAVGECGAVYPVPERPVWQEEPGRPRVQAVPADDDGRAQCPFCFRGVLVNRDGRIRLHRDRGRGCDGSGMLAAEAAVSAA